VAHIRGDKQQLLLRIRRLRGQVEALERAVLEEHECASVLQQIAACRGAMGGLMSEVIEGHIRFHVVGRDSRPGAAQTAAAEELIEVLRTYLK
jgi:DNA-binding FrmR family transcriptional regulator